MGTVAVEAVLKGSALNVSVCDHPFPGAAVRTAKALAFDHVRSQQATALFFSLGHEPQFWLLTLAKGGFK